METETFQHYQVLRRDDGSLWELGRGAMGVTYKAFDVNLRCHVALKVVNAQHLESEVSRQRFVREARAAAGLRHRHIASVYHLGNDAESFFYSMEFIDGETVEHLVTRLGPLPCADALGIAAQVARALGAASKQGLVHRDIKPANLMVVHEDEDDQFSVKVIDFGLARPSVASDQTAHITMAGFVGTPQYASPEQIEEQDLDSRSDIYSLGITLWYMLKGQPPFTGTIFRISSQHLTKEPPWEQLDHLPQPVLALLARMLQKDPANRPQNPVKLRLEIEACLRLVPASTLLSSLAPRPPATPVDDAAVSAPESEMTLVMGAGNGSTIHSAAMAGEATELQGPAPAVGGILAERYALLERIGEGSSGEVFRATDARQAGKEVAVKILRPGQGIAPQEFYHLQGDLGRLRAAPHACLIEPYALDQVRGYRYMAVEWVNGFTLVDLLRHRGRLELREAFRLIEQASDAATHCSAHGLHRLELATHQILMHFPGSFVGDKAQAVHAMVEQPLAEWPEFGLKLDALAPAREAGGTPTWAGAETLTPAPRIPNRDTQSSIRGLIEDNYFYALGALLYEMLSGAPPPPYESGDREVPPLPLLGEEANHVLRRALSSNPGFGNEREFYNALLAASDLGGDLRLEEPPETEPPALRADDSQAAATVARVIVPPPPPIVEEAPAPVLSPAVSAAPAAAPALDRPVEFFQPVAKPATVVPAVVALPARPATVVPLPVVPPPPVTAAVSPAPAPVVHQDSVPPVPLVTIRPLRPATLPAEPPAEVERGSARSRNRLVLPLVGVVCAGIVLVVAVLLLHTPKASTSRQDASTSPSPGPTARAETTAAPVMPTPAASPLNPLPVVVATPAPQASPGPSAAATPDGTLLPEVVNLPPPATPAPSPLAGSSPVATPPAAKASPTPVAKSSPTPADSPKKQNRESSNAHTPPPKVDPPTKKDTAPPRKDPPPRSTKPEPPPRSQPKAPPASHNSDDGAPGFMR